MFFYYFILKLTSTVCIFYPIWLDCHLNLANIITCNSNPCIHVGDACGKKINKKCMHLL